MSCNPSKCKELIVRKRVTTATTYEPVNNILQYSNIPLLGVTLQSDCKFHSHVRQKLVEANRGLHVLRTLRKEQYTQAEIDHLFISLVLPNFTYGLPVYGASDSDLGIIQHFLDRCHKRRFISHPVSINELLDNQDHRLFKKINCIEHHPLSPLMPSKKDTKYNLRESRCKLPKVNTVRYKSIFVNRLIFKYKLV